MCCRRLGGGGAAVSSCAALRLCLESREDTPDDSLRVIRGKQKHRCMRRQHISCYICFWGSFSVSPPASCFLWALTSTRWRPGQDLSSRSSALISCVISSFFPFFFRFFSFFTKCCVSWRPRFVGFLTFSQRAYVLLLVGTLI